MEGKGARFVRLFREWEKAVAASEKAAAARADLGPGATRARVTTANAKWARQAENRDRLAAELEELMPGWRE